MNNWIDLYNWLSALSSGRPAHGGASHKRASPVGTAPKLISWIKNLVLISILIRMISGHLARSQTGREDYRHLNFKFEAFLDFICFRKSEQIVCLKARASWSKRSPLGASPGVRRCFGGRSDRWASLQSKQTARWAISGKIWIDWRFSVSEFSSSGESPVEIANHFVDLTELRSSWIRRSSKSRGSRSLKSSSQEVAWRDSLLLVLHFAI